MPRSTLTLVCFAVKEEAAPFKAAIASRPDIQILLTGMGQRNAERSIRSALQDGAHNSPFSDKPRNLPTVRSPSPQPTPHGNGVPRPGAIRKRGFRAALKHDLPPRTRRRNGISSHLQYLQRTPNPLPHYSRHPRPCLRGPTARFQFPDDRRPTNGLPQTRLFTGQIALQNRRPPPPSKAIQGSRQTVSGRVAKTYIRGM